MNVCQKCYHIWTGAPTVERCPACKSYSWDGGASAAVILASEERPELKSQLDYYLARQQRRLS